MGSEIPKQVGHEPNGDLRRNFIYLNFTVTLLLHTVKHKCHPLQLCTLGKNPKVWNLCAPLLLCTLGTMLTKVWNPCARSLYQNYYQLPEVPLVQPKIGITWSCSQNHYQLLAKFNFVRQLVKKNNNL